MQQICVPVSIGELLDKITILQIKSEKISNPDKLKNIHTELAALLKCCQENGIDVHNHLVKELKSINEKLWNIEDAIRDKERKKEFDEEFIQLARSVYITNDERFRVKNEINRLTSSAFVEEKSYAPY